MRVLGLQGVVGGRRETTTIPEDLKERPLDRVNRTFTASRPNALWVADLTYVPTWRGLVYVAFVIDAFARRIVGWRVSSSLRSDIALDALEQALYDRDLSGDHELIHHSDRGVQTFVAQLAVERLDEPVLHRLSGPDEVELDVSTPSPFFERLRRELGSVVDSERQGSGVPGHVSLKGVHDLLARHRKIDLSTPVENCTPL